MRRAPRFSAKTGRENRAGSKLGELMVWTSRLAAAAAVFTWAALGHAQDSVQPPLPAGSVAGLRIEPLRLVRCFENAELGCFRVVADVRQDRALNDVDYRARLNTAELIGPGEIRSIFDWGGPINLLVVYDVSGSMKGNNMAFMRSAVHEFLVDVPSNVSTAVVPFASHAVRAPFDAARFEPTDGAIRQLSGLTDPKGNTALYSAIDFGLATLDQHTRADARSILLVITDGMNDVHPERCQRTRPAECDDTGLLDGQQGLETARELIGTSKHSVWLVGAGIADTGRTLMRYLAGTSAKAKFSEMELGALRDLFLELREEMTPTRLLAYAIPAGARSDLGRRPRTFQLEALATPNNFWRPPLVALPPFEGTADSLSLLQPRVAEMAAETPDSLRQRLMLGLPLMLLLILAHWFLPRVFEMPAPQGATTSEADPTIPRTERSATPSKPRRKAPVIENTVRLRVVIEAPPRKPGDITKDAAV